jgi:hypothetical protein
MTKYAPKLAKKTAQIASWGQHTAQMGDKWDKTGEYMNELGGMKLH